MSLADDLKKVMYEAAVEALDNTAHADRQRLLEYCQLFGVTSLPALHTLAENNADWMPGLKAFLETLAAREEEIGRLRVEIRRVLNGWES